MISRTIALVALLTLHGCSAPPRPPQAPPATGCLIVAGYVDRDLPDWPQRLNPLLAYQPVEGIHFVASKKVYRGSELRDLQIDGVAVVLLEDGYEPAALEHGHQACAAAVQQYPLTVSDVFLRSGKRVH